MPIFIGFILIPFIVLIIRKTNEITTNKRNKILLNLSLILISIIFIILCLAINEEPFNFEEHYSIEYMIYNGEYLLYSGVIFMFSPFMWIITIHFARMIYKEIKIRKNAIIKKEEEFIYYRGDLDKISPSIIMFTSMLDLDIKKSVASTILKLKLSGYIEENSNKLIYTNKEETTLLESEKMVLDYIRYNKFDISEYKRSVEKETIKNKYIVKNKGGKFGRIIKIFIAIIIPFVLFNLSIKLDNYMFENYKVWPEKDGHAYILLNNQADITLLAKEIKNKDDYYHRAMADGSMNYSENEIRADKMEYGVVRKTFLLNILTVFLVGFITIYILVALYIIIQQLTNINNNYTRTIKGKKLLNKAYALRNYLKDYSQIRTRTEEELILWEYYLVYAVSLGVNEDIEDNIIKKYITKL